MKQLLRINMEHQTTVNEMAEERGRSLIASMLHQEVDAKTDPLGPENKLIVCPGLFADTVAPARKSQR